MLISSGYRCLALNRAIGSSDTSDHIKAMAADFRAPAFGSPLEVSKALLAAAGEEEGQAKRGRGLDGTERGAVVTRPAHLDGTLRLLLGAACGRDTGYVDDDFLLGTELHAYLAVAIDRDGYISDTVGATPQYMRAATLDPGHILAINRSNKATTCIVDQVATGQFMREALAGYDFDVSPRNCMYIK
jgi:hypothetical protein